MVSLDRSRLRSRRDRRDPRVRVPDPRRGCDGVPAQQYDKQELRLAAVPRRHAGGPAALAHRVRGHARDVASSKTFVAYFYRLRGRLFQTWVVPRYGFQVLPRTLTFLLPCCSMHPRSNFF